MTRVEMIMTMRELYKDNLEVVKDFEKLTLNKDIKDRHLETIVKVHIEHKRQEAKKCL